MQNKSIATTTQQEYQYAGFWRRLCARVLDGAILMASEFIIIFIAAAIGLVEGHPLSPNPTPLEYLGVYIAYALYYTIMISSSWQATIGKRIMGVYVIKTDGSRLSFWRALGRETIGYFISGILLCIGYLTIAFTKKKTGFHDMIFSTYVVRGMPEESK